MPTADFPGAIPSLRGEFQPSGGGGREFRSRDGRRILSIQARIRSVRDLHDAFFRLAKALSRGTGVAQGVVAIWMPGPSDDRILHEWETTLDLLKPSISSRMRTVVVRPDRCVPSEKDRDLARIGEAIRSSLGRLERPARKERRAVTAMFFEVFKILLGRWLLGRGPMTIGELMRVAGCSYPTVAEALRRLERTQELVRRSNRSVQLARFPRRTWGEILALAETLRRTQCYADSSGRTDGPQALHRRLQSMASGSVALGGVQAARHWDPHFDLHGLPRLDVSLAPTAGADAADLARRLDPALQHVEPGAPGVILAVHPLFRAEPLFEKNVKGKIGWADPVETLLDLDELRLVDQAERLVERLAERFKA
jgi:hypothetical protein